MLASNRRWNRLCGVLCTVGAALGVARPAGAHIDMTVPVPREHGIPREPNSNLKQGPCGQRVNGRTERVNVFAPGETIEVTWRETTNHQSYYRIAFDRDGDDAFPMFDGPGTGAAGIDPSGPCPVDGQVILAYDMDDRAGGSHTLRVRLPDVECEGCTLQVIQFMYDTSRPYYFQCADLALRRPDAGALTPGGAGGDSGLDAGLDAAAAATDAARASGEPQAAAGCRSRIAPLAATPASPEGEPDVAPPARGSGPTRASGDAAGPTLRELPAAAPPQRSRDGGCSLLPEATPRDLGTPVLAPFGVILVLSMRRHGSHRSSLRNRPSGRPL